MQLRGSSWQGSIISSHLLSTLLKLSVEGTWGEIISASPIAIPIQACTQWTHSDVCSQLAITPECLFIIGDRQSEKKRRNGNQRAICSATRSIDAGCGVMRHRGVSDGSAGAHPLWCSYSARTEMFFANGPDEMGDSVDDIETMFDWYHSDRLVGLLFQFYLLSFLTNLAFFLVLLNVAMQTIECWWDPGYYSIIWKLIMSNNICIIRGGYSNCLCTFR